MNFTLWLSVLLLCGFLQSSGALPDSIINKAAKVAILTAVKTLTHHGNIDLLPSDGKSIEFKNTTNIIQGTLSCKRIYLYGLEALQVKSDDIKIEMNSKDKQIQFGLNASIPSDVGVNVSNYFSDLGIINSIPVYGTGNVTAFLGSLLLNLSALVKYGPTFNLTDVYLRPNIGPAKVKLNGFWNNDEFSEVLSVALTAALDIIELLWNFELDLITCILSSVVESLVNKSDIFADLKERCTDGASRSSYGVVRDAFKGDLREFIQNPSEEVIIRHIESFVKYINAKLQFFI